jgi:hypothetical protein
MRFGFFISIGLLLILGSEVTRAQSTDWRMIFWGGAADVFPGGDLYSGREGNVGWCAGLRVHRLQGLSGVGGLFGGGSVHSVVLAGEAVQFLSLEGGNAFSIDDRGSHGYVLGGLDIYLQQVGSMRGSAYTLEKPPVAGIRLETGIAVMLHERLGVDLNVAGDFVSVRFEDRSFSTSSDVRISSLFSVGVRLYVGVADF